MIKRLPSKMEKKIDKDIKQLYKDCNGTEKDEWKLRFISDLNEIKLSILQRFT